MTNVEKGVIGTILVLLILLGFAVGIILKNESREENRIATNEKNETVCETQLKEQMKTDRLLRTEIDMVKRKLKNIVAYEDGIVDMEKEALKKEIYVLNRKLKNINEFFGVTDMEKEVLRVE